MIQEVPFRRKHQDGGFVREIELEDARRGAVFDRIQTARLFLAVKEVAIPDRLMVVGAVAESDDGGQSVVRTPDAALAILLGFEAEGAVLVMSGVEIATREKWPNEELYRFGSGGSRLARPERSRIRLA